MTRRQFMLSTASGAMLLPACSNQTAKRNYENLIQETWGRSKLINVGGMQLRRELVRYATLAPSSHNTQCWKFKIEEKAITILPDLKRRCPSVDPNDHHLFVSLGCATENLIQAAQAYGFRTDTTFNNLANDGIKISLENTKSTSSNLFNAITERQSTRTEYENKTLSLEELRSLEAVGLGKGVNILIFTEKNMTEKILEYILLANSIQLKDQAFIKELKTWVRFNKNEAVQKKDGLFSLAAGNPSIPTWMGNLFFDFILDSKSENEKYVKQVRSSSGIAIFTSDSNHEENWIEVGRCYERFALLATSLGIRNAFLNQPIEVPTLKHQFETFLGLGDQRADLIVRFGRGRLMPRSLRRPLDAVII